MVSEYIDYQGGVQAQVDLIPRKAKRDYTPDTMYDVLRGFSRRVPMARMMEYEDALRTYIAAIVVDAVRQANDTLVVPNDLKLDKVPPAVFEDHKL